MREPIKILGKINLDKIEKPSKKVEVVPTPEVIEDIFDENDPRNMHGDEYMIMQDELEDKMSSGYFERLYNENN